MLDYAEEVSIEQVLTVGEKVGRGADDAHNFDRKESLEDRLREMNFSDTTVLLKASRSIKLETILKSINS